MFGRMDKDWASNTNARTRKSFNKPSLAMIGHFCEVEASN